MRVCLFVNSMQSWHWESRNYNKWATENLKRRLTALTVSDVSKGVEVCITDASDVKAEVCCPFL
ncbi:hypothetical protein EON66_11195 [archaeon]|nr:MAG: hypothetical protein EON66_11195 [archaeon]